MSVLPTANLSAEFSQHILANVATPCDRFYACKVTIPAGTMRLYMGNADPTLPGKYLCSSCFQEIRDREREHRQRLTLMRTETAAQIKAPASSQNSRLLDQSSTTIRPSSGVPPRTTSSAPFSMLDPPDVHSIQRQINESWRQGAHTPQGHVTAMMPPSQSLPNVNQHSSSSQTAPAIPHPSFFKQYYSAAGDTGPGTGYSASHAHYHDARAQWASKSYSKPAPAPPTTASQSGRPKENRSSSHVPAVLQLGTKVFITVEVLYLTGSGIDTEKTTIKEGLHVEYGFTPAQIFNTVHEGTIGPLTQIHPGFAWDFSSMVLREAALWIDIMKADPHTPYFSGRLTKPKSMKANAPIVLDLPKKPILFQLFIDEKQWLRAEKFTEDLRIRTHDWQSEKASQKRKTPPSPQKIPMPARSKTKTVISTPPSFEFPENLTSSSQGLPSSILTGNAIAGLNTLSAVKSSLSEPFNPIDAEDIKNGIDAIGSHTAIMKHRQQYDKKLNKVVYCYLINYIPFREICRVSDKEALIVDQQSHSATLSYNLDSGSLGRGAFKDAKLATLTWLNPPPLGLGAQSVLPQQVAMKRPYRELPVVEREKRTRAAAKSDVTNAATRIARLGFADESASLHTEATLLGWADSLLRYSYSFLDDFISRKTSSQPPFTIPRLRFVNSCLAYSAKAVDNSSHLISTNRAVYLLEEFIPDTENTPFIKYVHNGSAKPLPTEHEPGYELRVFLCFLQHVQYQQTHKQVFISDYQGAGDLLTDPQIMTEKSTEGRNLFGEGNVHNAFTAFPAQHQCSDFCKWFELGELEV